MRETLMEQGKTFTKEEKQILANEVYAIVEKLNRAVEQAAAAGLRTSFFLLPGTTINIHVDEIIPFGDSREKPTESGTQSEQKES